MKRILFIIFCFSVFATNCFADSILPIRYNVTLGGENVYINGLTNLLTDSEVNNIHRQLNDIGDSFTIDNYNSLHDTNIEIKIKYTYDEKSIELKIYKYNKLLIKRKFNECFCYKYPWSWLKDLNINNKTFVYYYEIGNPQLIYIYLYKHDGGIYLIINEDAKYNYTY